MREADLVKKIVKALEGNFGGFTLKTHGGLYQRTGIPDILYWTQGKAFALEVKLPEEKHPVSELQKDKLVKLHNAGVYTGVVHSVEEALSIIEKEIPQTF